MVTYNTNIINFFEAETQNISTAPVSVAFSNGVFKIWGTWNGATVQLQTSTPIAGTYIFITDTSGNPIT